MVPESSTTAASSAESSSAESSAAESSTETSAESQVDVVSLSRELGIEVWAVSTVGEAYNGFTGHLVAAPAGPAPTIRPDFLQRIEAQVASVQAALEDSIALAAAEGSVTAEQESTARAQLAASRQQSDAAEPADAYATAVAALVVVNQLTASASAAEVIEDRGSADAAADQIALAKEQAGRAEEALASASSKAATTSPVQQIAAVAALTWLAKAVAVLRTISSELAASGGRVDSQVLEAAEVNAQYGVVVERIFPDSFALAQLLQPSPEAEPTAMAAFMGAYSDLLSSAGSANQRYYEEVLTSISRSPELTFSQPGHLYGAVQQLQELSSASARTGSGAVQATDSTSATPSATTTASAPPPENVAAANYLARCAWDFAYYTSSAYLVSAEQAYGLTGTGIGSLSVTASDAGALASALMSGTTTVDAYSTQLAGYGIDPDHGLWAARSGDAMARVGTGTRHEVASAATGLQLVWDGAIEVFMGNAANRSLAGQG